MSDELDDIQEPPKGDPRFTPDAGRTGREMAPVASQEKELNPFRRNSFDPAVINAGAVTIEVERAIAEAQGKLVVAKRFPRDRAAAFEQVMDSCSRPGLANDALYTYARGGSTVSGPSIRLAEELARCWGNIDYGLRELSRRDGESEYEAYAWDLQTNTSSGQKFMVKHKRDTKGGGKALTDERDIYEIGANMGARRMRARILAILPGDLVEAAVAKCRQTIAGKSTIPIADRIQMMLTEFNKLGIRKAHIEGYIGRPSDQFLDDDIVTLRGIFKSINDGITKAGDWFKNATVNSTSTGGKSLADAMAKVEQGDKQEAKPEPEITDGLEDNPPPPDDDF